MLPFKRGSEKKKRKRKEKAQKDEKAVANGQSKHRICLGKEAYNCNNL